MSADKYPSIFSRQMEAIVYVTNTFFGQGSEGDTRKFMVHSKLTNHQCLRNPNYFRQETICRVKPWEITCTHIVDVMNWIKISKEIRNLRRLFTVSYFTVWLESSNALTQAGDRYSPQISLSKKATTTNVVPIDLFSHTENKGPSRD